MSAELFALMTYGTACLLSAMVFLVVGIPIGVQIERRRRIKEEREREERAAVLRRSQFWGRRGE